MVRSPQPPTVTPAAQQNTEPSESSCASSSSDKENKSDSDCEPQSLLPPVESEFDPTSPSTVVPISPPVQFPQQEEQSQPHPNMRELCYYLYPGGASYHQRYVASSSSGVNPVLLAVAAAASEGRSLSPVPRTDERNDDSTVFRRRQEEVPTEPSLPVTEPSVYLCPEPLPSMQRRSPPYHFQLPPPEYLEEPVHISLPLTPAYSSPSSSSSCSSGRQRRPEDADESEMEPSVSAEEHDPLLTPPSSNPVSPVPSSSPDPIDLATVSKEALILPPRKRSKMILKSMESAAPEVVSVRSRSVIHYARAS